MEHGEPLRVSDPAVVARYLQLRSQLHDRVLARVESFIEERYLVTRGSRGVVTLTSLVRGGFLRPGEGELWPVIFLTAVDVTFAVCLQISPERLASLGTTIEGPQKNRHRHWEGWWGWECPLSEIAPHFFDLPSLAQEDAMVAWYGERLEWMAQNGLIRRI